MQNLYLIIRIDNAELDDVDYADRKHIPIHIDKNGVWTICTTPGKLIMMDPRETCNAITSAVRQFITQKSNAGENISGSFNLTIGIVYPNINPIHVRPEVLSAIDALVQNASVMSILRDGDVFVKITRDIIDAMSVRKKHVDTDDTDDEDDDQDPEYDPDDPWSILGAMGLDIDKARSKSRKKKGKSKSSPPKKHYSKSRVVSASKNPKQQYKRHGIIVYNNKKYMKRDREVVKSFLKDFIPGNSQWKKDFRNDLLDRWMKMFAVSKKRLAALEKSYAASNRPVRRLDAQKILDYTNRILTSSRDQWNNPNK